MPTSPDERPPEFLRIEDVQAGYGTTLVVNGMSATVGHGEVVVIIGPNGSGKSTLLKAVTGELPVVSGRVRLGGSDVTNHPRDRLARSGVGFVPQEREVFKGLSVRENLLVGGYLLKRRERDEAITRVMEAFPALLALQGSAAGRLSGGERKMLAIGRALMLSPKLIVLDEPSAGLAPSVASELLSELIPALAAAGTAILLVEQRAIQALEVGDWAYVMMAGKAAMSDSAANILRRDDVGALFLGRAQRPASPSTDSGEVSARV